MTKQPTSRDILGTNIVTYRKWDEYQYTPEVNWSNIVMDHEKPISLFDVAIIIELKNSSNWINTQLLLKEIHLQKGTK